ncbi:MAG: hypothetical protein ACJ74Z_10725 [Bryobacteraceae bacterium]
MNLPTDDLMLAFIPGVTAGEDRCTIEISVGQGSKADPRNCMAAGGMRNPKARR